MLKTLFGWLFKRDEPPIIDEKWSMPYAKTELGRPSAVNPMKGRIRVPMKGNGTFSFDIVGESNYQVALEKISGRKTAEGKSFKCLAEVMHEPENPHDPNAVVVKIDGSVVGYFSKPDAKDYFTQIGESGKVNVRSPVTAMIVGGSKTKSREGHYGVKLDVTRHS